MSDINESMAKLRGIQAFRDKVLIFVDPVVRDIAVLLTQAEEAQKTISEFHSTKIALEKSIEDLKITRDIYEKKEREYRLAFEAAAKEMDQQKIALNLQLTDIRMKINLAQEDLESLLDDKVKLERLSADIKTRENEIKDMKEKRKKDAA